MKTVKFAMNYDFAPIKKVEIENEMAPLTISASSSGKLEIEAELRLEDRSPDNGYDEYFDVSYDNGKVSISLEEIPELREPFFGTGRSQVTIRIPQGTPVLAEAEVLPLNAEGYDGELDLRNENGPLMLSHCAGNKVISNENGPVRISSCSGDLDIKMENGPITAEKANGGSLKISSENGPVRFREASFPKVEISNENGAIHYETLAVEAGEFNFTNENGTVHLTVPEDFDFELIAETELGSVVTNIAAEIETSEDRKIIRRGENGTKINVRTENGSVKISTDGQSDIGYLKLKIRELKEMIGKAVSDEDKEQVLGVLQKIVGKTEKTLGGINETLIKEKLAVSLEKLKAAVEGFEVKETKDKVVKAVEQAGDELADSLKEIFRKVKGPSREGESGRHEHRFHFGGPFGGKGFEFSHDSFEPESIKDYIHKVMETALGKAGKGMSSREKSEVDERSRIKILEMLEAGKITAEEAERLLKAIGKE